MPMKNKNLISKRHFNRSFVRVTRLNKNHTSRFKNLLRPALLITLYSLTQKTFLKFIVGSKENCYSNSNWNDEPLLAEIIRVHVQ